MREICEKYDVIIVGAGVAGLNVALNLPRDKRVLLLAKESLKHSDSYLAQGGMCVMRGEADYAAFFEDTMRAGHRENSPEAVDCMLRHSEEIAADLVRSGVDFTRDRDGNFAYTREGGHSRARILYHEDCTGKAISLGLLKQVKRLKNVTVRPYTVLLDILCDEEKNECCGAVLSDAKTGELKAVYADYVVLATGGIGGLFRFSTNFRSLTGDGVAIALKHGVAVENVDYIQIHPTTLYTKKRGRRFLISESVRGEGAVLIDAKGERFTDELQPRDIVTAAIRKKMSAEGSKFVRLDLRTIAPDRVRLHFPQIVKRCAEEGYDVFNEPIPVVPGQHYFMGGIKSDTHGRMSMARLFAVGETCSNGVHGKNRLASNSLLESLVFAKRAALKIGAEYTPVDQKTVERAKHGFNEKEYEDRKTLFAAYRKAVLGEVERAQKAREKTKDKGEKQ